MPWWERGKLKRVQTSHTWSPSDSPRWSKFQSHHRSFKLDDCKAPGSQCSNWRICKKHMHRVIFTIAEWLSLLHLLGKDREEQEPLVLQPPHACATQQGCFPLGLAPAALLSAPALPSAPAGLYFAFTHTRVINKYIHKRIYIYTHMYTVIYIHIYMYTHTETEVRPFFPQRGRGERFPLEYVDNCPCGGGTKPALGSGKPSPAPAAAAPRTYPCGPRCWAPPSPAAAAPPQRTHIRGRRLLRPAAGGSGWAALPGREAGPGGQPRRGSPPGAARARSTPPPEPVMPVPGQRCPRRSSPSLRRASAAAAAAGGWGPCPRPRGRAARRAAMVPWGAVLWRRLLRKRWVLGVVFGLSLVYFLTSTFKQVSAPPRAPG